MSDDEKPSGYMFLPGVPGLALTVGRPMPLFGAEGNSFVAPDPKMTRRHFVVYPKTLATGATDEQKDAFQKKHRTAEAAAQQAYNQATLVGRVSKTRDPQKAVEYREGKFIIPSHIGDACDVASGQAKFYVASNTLRELIVQFTKDTMAEVFPDLHAMATIVTVVDQPIHARPLNAELPYMGNQERYEERGFEVVAAFRQFVTLGMPHAEIAEFSIHSEKGEYPLIVPRDMEMGMLLRMDGAVQADPDIKRTMTMEERASRLIAKLKGV